MKKFVFCLMALALCALTFVSCNKDDDDDNNSTPVANITANGGFNFSATALSKATSASESADVTGLKNKISDIFKSNSDRITIYGVNTSKQFMSITVNATKGQTGTYTEGLNATELLINYLQGGSIADALKGSIDALIIYKASPEADENSASFWFSTNATVTITNNLNLGAITYMTGTFSATMMNTAKETRTINGTFTCPGI